MILGIGTDLANGERTGRPILVELTEGQARDGRSAADMCAPVRAGQSLPAARANDSDVLHEAAT